MASMADATREVDLPRARALIEAYNREELEIADADLDAALGFGRTVLADAIAGEPAAEAEHPGESIVHLATPYARCRAFFRTVSLGPEDLVIDLGCGTGRVVVYGSLVTPARFCGIELVESRAEVARSAVGRLGLERARIIHGNVLEQDIEAGTAFFAFRPFSAETEARVLARLHGLARHRSIAVGAYRFMPGLFDPEVFTCIDWGDLRIYRS
jgi:hypothetical protein